MTFSACFGGPFMVHHPYRYAELLKRKIERYGVNCWLVNTGWIGGPYGVGKRISIKYTRALLDAALSGTLLDVEYDTDPVFGFRVPKTCAGVPAEVLNPAESWPDKERLRAEVPAAGGALHRELQEVRGRVPAGGDRGGAEAL